MALQDDLEREVCKGQLVVSHLGTANDFESLHWAVLSADSKSLPTSVAMRTMREKVLKTKGVLAAINVFWNLGQKSSHRKNLPHLPELKESTEGYKHTPTQFADSIQEIQQLRQALAYNQQALAAVRNYQCHTNIIHYSQQSLDSTPQIRSFECPVLSAIIQEQLERRFHQFDTALEDDDILVPEAEHDMFYPSDAPWVSHYFRFTAAQHLVFLDRSLESFQTSLAITSRSHPQRARRCSYVAKLLRERFELGQNSEDLHNAIMYDMMALALLPVDHEDRLPKAIDLAARLEERFSQTGNFSDILIAVLLGEEILANTRESHPLREFLQGLKRETLKDAIASLRDSTESVRSNSERVSQLLQLAEALEIQYCMDGELGTFELAISAYEQILDTAEQWDAATVTRLSQLVDRLFYCYEHSEDLEILEKGIAYSKQLVAASLQSDLDQIRRLSNHLKALNILENAKRIRTLNMAIEQVYIAQQNLNSTVKLDGHESRHSLELSCALFHEFATADDLQSALLHAEVALSFLNGDRATGVEQVNCPTRLTCLMQLLRVTNERQCRLEAIDDLEKTISYAKEIEKLLPPDDDRKASMLSLLGQRYEWLYLDQGDPEDLETAVNYGIAAIEGEHPERARHLTNLATSLISRSELMGDLQNLEDAIQYNTEAVQTTECEKKLLVYQSYLARSLNCRYRRTGAQCDLNEAIRYAQKIVVEVDPGDNNRPWYLHHLACMLDSRYQKTQIERDILRAIALFNQAAYALPEQHPQRVRIVFDTALALYHRFEISGDSNSLEQAIYRAKTGTESTPRTNPDRARRLYHLGLMLKSSYELHKNPTIEIDSLKAFDGAYKTKNAPPLARILAARSAASSMSARGRHTDAYTLLKVAVTLLASVSSGSLVRKDQEYILSKLNGFAAEMASTALVAGKEAYQALQQLEKTRGIITGLRIDCRSEVSELRKLAPHLHLEFTALKRQMNAGPDNIEKPDRSIPTLDRNRFHEQRLNAHRRRSRIRAEWTEIIARIRNVPGLDRFHHPPDPRELKPLAIPGPIVTVVSSPIGSHAIIVTQSGIRSLDLGKLLFNDIRNKMRLKGRGRYKKDIPAELKKLVDQDIKAKRTREMLRWLWEAAVEPILRNLGLLSEAELPPDQKPHVWWIGVGPLSMAPFHAAGDYPVGGVTSEGRSCRRNNALYHVVSSHIPTIKALSYSRERPFRDVTHENTNLLLVTVAKTPGKPDLNEVLLEVDEIMKLKPKFLQTHHLESPNAQTVLKDFKSYHAMHFACHGISDNMQPSNSHLLLVTSGEDGAPTQTDKLTVDTISQVRSRNAQIAYLSACSTAHASGRLADETIHIASGFLLAGFNHVLATLWPSETNVCQEVAVEFYRELFREDMALSGHIRVSTALHTAQLKAKDLHWDNPYIWAAFIHIGA